MTMLPLASSVLDSLRCSKEIFPSSALEDPSSPPPRSVGGAMPELDCLCSNACLSSPVISGKPCKLVSSAEMQCMCE